MLAFFIQFSFFFIFWFGTKGSPNFVIFIKQNEKKLWPQQNWNVRLNFGILMNYVKLWSFFSTVAWHFATSLLRRTKKNNLHNSSQFFANLPNLLACPPGFCIKCVCEWVNFWCECMCENLYPSTSTLHLHRLRLDKSIKLTVNTRKNEEYNKYSCESRSFMQSNNKIDKNDWETNQN